MTALLVLTVFSFVSRERLARWTPVAVCVLIAALIWRAGRYTGTSLNPARSAAPAIAFGDLKDLWLYLVAPIAGAVAVAVAWPASSRSSRPKTAKLLHDPRYPCSLATDLPAEPPVTGPRPSRLSSRLHPVTRRNE
jgi:hypothetical protein